MKPSELTKELRDTIESAKKCDHCIIALRLDEAEVLSEYIEELKDYQGWVMRCLGDRVHILEHGGRTELAEEVRGLRNMIDPWRREHDDEAD